MGNRPRRGIFVNNGTEYWVSNELSGTVSVIDTFKQEIRKTINFSVDGIRDQQITPVDFAYAVKKNLVFVTLGNANHVAAVDATSYEIKKYILAGKRVWGADISTDEKELIVTNGNSDDISIIDLERFVTVKDIPIGKTPHTVRIKNKMFHLLSSLLLFLLHVALLANSDQFKIGYIDFDNDIRYADWGRHPVDIRSQHNHQPRAIDGAILGVNEAKRIQRITKIKVTMKHFRIKNENALYDFLISSDIKEFKVILLDISIKNPEKIARLLQANKNIIFFNVSDQNNSLRSDICLENLFHTFPSDLMRTDSLAQFLVEKKWNKTLMLTGSLEEDKSILILSKNLLRNSELK